MAQNVWKLAMGVMVEAAKKTHDMRRVLHCDYLDLVNEDNN